MTNAELKAKVFAAIDANAERIIEIGETIWKNPEPGYREYKTAALTAGILNSLNLPTQEKLGLTGVRGDMTFSSEGPTIAMLGEMDSLILPTHPECDPETGAVHSCGHNASMAGMLGAAIGIAAAGISKELSGKIAFVAVPAEECIEIEKRLEMISQGKIASLGGKGELIRRGVFDDVALSFMLHSGGGYAYHHCFYGKQFSLKIYDELWKPFLQVGHDPACALRLAWVAFVFPLSPTIQMLYTAYPVTWLVTAAAHYLFFLAIRKHAYNKTSDMHAIS